MNSVELMLEVATQLKAGHSEFVSTRRWLPAIERMLEKHSSDEILDAVKYLLADYGRRSEFLKYGISYLELRLQGYAGKVAGERKTQEVLKKMAAAPVMLSMDEVRSWLAENGKNPILVPKLQRILELGGYQKDAVRTMLQEAGIVLPAVRSPGGDDAACAVPDQSSVSSGSGGG